MGIKGCNIIITALDMWDNGYNNLLYQSPTDKGLKKKQSDQNIRYGIKLDISEAAVVSNLAELTYDRGNMRYNIQKRDRYMIQWIKILKRSRIYLGKQI